MIKRCVRQSVSAPVGKGSRAAGVDGVTASTIMHWVGVEEFLDELRNALRDRSFRPLPVRERMIPKANGKLRRLGIATIRDRVVQASVKLVLEPIFEADFYPGSLRVPSEAPHTRRGGRSAPLRDSLLRVDRRGRYQGLLR